MKAERDDDRGENQGRRAFPWVNLLVAAGIVLVIAFFWFQEEPAPAAVELASPAVALASKVLPVPGGPIRSIPCGMRAPMSRKRSGFFR